MRGVKKSTVRWRMGFHRRCLERRGQFPIGCEWKSRHGEKPSGPFFFPAFSYNLKMSSSPLAAALASLFSSGSAQRCFLLPRSLLGFIQRPLATVGFVVSSQLSGGWFITWRRHQQTFGCWKLAKWMSEVPGWRPERSSGRLTTDIRDRKTFFCP